MGQCYIEGAAGHTRSTRRHLGARRPLGGAAREAATARVRHERRRWRPRASERLDLLIRRGSRGPEVAQCVRGRRSPPVVRCRSRTQSVEQVTSMSDRDRSSPSLTDTPLKTYIGRHDDDYPLINGNGMYEDNNQCISVSE
ncbi:uncharacterized protein LOC123880451 [Maniola jurtina]|uniref:uncharacterized protein LOC123880451 n=1 Tax=Maniola jurtina TaxID=191418 RepID=UPI001E68C3CD|nr:uncharacterized protein LOC123880451 [Maniola jurtina]